MANIDTTSDSYTLLLLTEPSMTITALIACLNNALSAELILVEKHQIEEKLSQYSGLVLIDLKVFTANEITPLKKQLSSYNNQHVFSLLNAPELSAKDIAGWPFIKGVFKQDDGLDELCSGIQKMYQGEYWLPRQKLTELIHYYQQNTFNTIHYSDICLTNREQQILRKLVTGASNCEIADGLFVSEHTVKSHLYNIFKKINVRNRVQAVFWAKNNLSIIENEHFELNQ